MKGFKKFFSEADVPLIGTDNDTSLDVRRLGNKMLANQKAKLPKTPIQLVVDKLVQAYKKGTLVPDTNQKLKPGTNIVPGGRMRLAQMIPELTMQDISLLIQHNMWHLDKIGNWNLELPAVV